MKYDFLGVSKAKLKTALSADQFAKTLSKYVEDNYRVNENSAYSMAQTMAAVEIGVSLGFLNNVIHGHKKPSELILDEIGYDKHVVTFYTKRED